MFIQYQWMNVVRVVEGYYVMFDDYCYVCVCVVDQVVGCCNCCEDVVCFQWVVMEVIQFIGENIEEDFGIRGGIDMVVFFFKQFFMQFVCIGQVVVMC